MARPYRSLSILSFIAITVNVGLWSPVIPAQACRFSEARLGGNSNESAQKSDLSGNSVGSLGDSGQQDEINNSVLRAGQSSSSLDLKQAGMMGLGAIASLAVISILFRVRHSRHPNPATDDIFRDYPELEHPELVVTSVPKEAFSSSAIAREFVVSR